MSLRLALLAIVALALPGWASAEAVYPRHVVFDNARVEGAYFYSKGSAVAPSRLVLDRDKLPVDRNAVHSPPNSLLLAWTSAQGGGWWATLEARKDFGNPTFDGDTLSFWALAEQDIAKGASPRLILVDTDGVTTPAIAMLPDLVAGQWAKVRLPLSAFVGLYGETGDQHFNAAKLARITIVQGLDDGSPHRVHIDDIRVESTTNDRAAPGVPVAVAARGYERHVDISWTPPTDPDVEVIRIYRSEANQPFALVATQRADFRRFEDFVGRPGFSARYRVSAVDAAGNESPLSPVVGAATRAMTDDQLLDMVQQAQFRYYWEGAHPKAGMAIEITPGDPDQIALGSSGFGIMALLVGAERGFATRAEVADRMLRILRFLKTADRFHGVWPHFLNGNTGRKMAYFGKYDDGGDLVETAFLMQGLLCARQYFDHADPRETEIRNTITQLWRTVEWDWYRKDPSSDFLYWHWSPDYGFKIGHPLIGWNETMIVYLLAIASPTHAVPTSLYHSGWAGQSPLAIAYRQAWSRTTDGDHYVNGHSYFGHRLDVGEGNGSELFFTQFSFMGFDPRNKRDRYTNYFDNNRAIALISHDYALANPRAHVGYGDDAWGQSAGVHSGGGRPRPVDDNGTLTVHAALGSMPYTPRQSMAALKHYYRDLGAKTWGVYGFTDGFNETDNWHEEVYMALNQAPTVVMIENARSGLLWRLFMKNVEISPALDAIGFRRDEASAAEAVGKGTRR